MFFIERSNSGGGWDIICVSPEPVTLADIQRPAGQYPVNYSEPGLVGAPCLLARIRVDGAVYEVYEWAQVPLNAADPESFSAWGWRLALRDTSIKFDAAPSWLSVTRGSAPQGTELSVPGGSDAPQHPDARMRADQSIP